MLMKISKLNLSYLTKSCRHTLSPNEKILRHIYFFVAFCDNGDRQREPWTCTADTKNKGLLGDGEDLHRCLNNKLRLC